jgi:hypothetical protein
MIRKMFICTSYERIWSGGVAPHVFNLGTRWWQMVSFTPKHFIAGKTYAGNPKSRFGSFGKVANLLLPPGIEPRFLRRPDPSIVTMPMTLRGFHYVKLYLRRT